MIFFLSFRMYLSLVCILSMFLLLLLGGFVDFYYCLSVSWIHRNVLTLTFAIFDFITDMRVIIGYLTKNIKTMLLFIYTTTKPKHTFRNATPTCRTHLFITRKHLPIKIEVNVHCNL